MKRLNLFLVIIILMIGFNSCEESPTEQADPTYSVRYTVSGSTTLVNITMENDDGGVSQFSDVSVPWSYSFGSKKLAGTFVYISAQNQNNNGTVIVTIYKDNAVFKTSTSAGAYVIATASGSL